ncbi:hypothetical protein GIW56_23645 [Pseudomonas gessardii]|uniref:Uncharacterized protein n=1 Tax=Pseudomonas gessardii TaxID=78544 RepID=A0ABS9FBV0_9PSED|nr:hypothetical protein [Pseudomonas gessardii]MBO4968469.1 hypothetical protein [Pseudomonas sp.]MBP3859055.1 hypothetical protein [Pseudomonas sp.]MBP3933243.1 hypothetical protein [Pseudomonas sp.]MCF4982273.1 hypothetical protein [Pseudomonas gessardii]MCF4990289.1 hypothetical protein [Pseudomonas gessardii]
MKPAADILFKPLYSSLIGHSAPHEVIIHAPARHLRSLSLVRALRSSVGDLLLHEAFDFRKQEKLASRPFLKSFFLVFKLVFKSCF